MRAIPQPSIYLGALAVIGRVRDMEMERRSGRVQDSINSQKPIPVDKQPGAITPKQEIMNDGRDRFVGILAHRSKTFFYESLPPAPDAIRMRKVLNSNMDTAESIATEHHPDPVPPFSGQVLNSYQQNQSNNPMPGSQPSLGRTAI